MGKSCYLSFSLTAGCGLKLLRWFIVGLVGSPFIQLNNWMRIEIRQLFVLKCICRFFIQLNSWMWIETSKRPIEDPGSAQSTFSLIVGCGLKLVGNKGINLCIPIFIQLNNWMWIEIVGCLALLHHQGNFHPA